MDIEIFPYAMDSGAHSIIHYIIFVSNASEDFVNFQLLFFNVYCLISEVRAGEKTR